MAKGNFIEYVVSDDPNKYPNGSVQGGYYYEKVVKSTATSVPTDLIPEIVCADNHLRDIVIEDGVAYARVGFYSADIGKSFSLTVNENISVAKMVVIGPGGKGGICINSNVTGSPGGRGEKKEKINFIISSGNLTVELRPDNTTVNFINSAQYAESVIATKGSDGADGGESSSASPVEGTNGYYLDLMPQIRRRCNGSNADLYTGAGIGAGGPGNEISDKNYEGILGGVFIYVRL